MLGKRTITTAAAALLLGSVAVAQAGSENQSDPTRGIVFGPMGQRMGGGAVNPVDHRSTGGRRGGLHVAAGTPFRSPESAYAYVPQTRYHYQHDIWHW